MQLKLVDEQKKMLLEKLSSFEDGIITQFKQATQNLDLSVYNESLTRVEKDMRDIYSQVGRVIEESNQHE